MNENIDKLAADTSELLLSWTTLAVPPHQGRTLTPYALCVCSSAAPCLLAAPTVRLCMQISSSSLPLQSETTSCYCVNKHQTVANGHPTMRTIAQPANLTGCVVANVQNTIRSYKTCTFLVHQKQIYYTI